MPQMNSVAMSKKAMAESVSAFAYPDVLNAGQSLTFKPFAEGDYVSWRNAKGQRFRGHIMQVGHSSYRLCTAQGQEVFVARVNSSLQHLETPICEGCGQHVTPKGCACFSPKPEHC